MTPNPIIHVSVILLEGMSWVLALASVYFCFRRTAAPYMRTFPLYCFANCIPGILYQLYGVRTAFSMTLFTGFELCYFVYFFSRIIPSPKITRLLWTTTAVILIYALTGLLTFQRHVNLTFILLECFVLVVVVLLYFRALFLSPVFVNLWKESSYWMATGVLFYFVPLVPTMIFSYYFFATHNLYMTDISYSVNTYAQMISYALYFKSMTCHTPNP